MTTSPIVHIEGGAVQGVALDGLEQYIEIPYAADTSGSRRFRPPAPVVPWDGVRQATSWTTRTPQYADTGIGRTPKQWFAIQGEYYAPGMSEDNLTVNVWTPSSTSGSRPVVFWIHGGGFTVGHAGSPMSDGAAFARRYDAVFVSVTHRLNAFGFLDLEGLAGPDYAGSGLAGMLDLVAALEWVQRNVASFGGDPGNVTIIGESGGGAKVSTLLVMNGVDGLFHRAVCQSGIALTAITRQESETYANALIAELGGTDVSALLDASMEDLLDAQVRVEKTHPGIATPRPVIDGARLPDLPEKIWADGGGSSVPVLAGSAHDEVSVFGPTDLDIDVQLPDSYHHGVGRGETPLYDVDAGLGLIDRFLGMDASSVVDARRLLHPDESDADTSLALMGDIIFRRPSVKFAELRADAGKQTWLYRLDWASPRIAPRGAPHSSSVSFFFDDVQLVDFTRGLDDAQTVADQMSGALDALMRTGRPEHPGVGAWPPYDRHDAAVMVFDVPPHVESDPDGAVVRAIDDLNPKPFL